MRGRPAPANVDYTPYKEFLLCQKWGCTPSQLRNESAWDVEMHLAFMEMEAEAQKANNNRRKR